MTKIANELEAKEIGKVVSSITDNKLCTATRATELGCEYPSKYIGKRLVPKDVLTKAENLPTFMYSGGYRDYVNQPEFEIYFDYYSAKPVMFIFEIDPWGSEVMADIWVNSKKYQADKSPFKTGLQVKGYGAVTVKFYDFPTSSNYSTIKFNNVTYKNETICEFNSYLTNWIPCNWP